MSSLGCKEWQTRTAGVHTLVNFYLNFRNTENEFKRSLTTTITGGYYTNSSISNQQYILSHASPNHLQYNFAVINMATNEIPFTTTSTAFSVPVTVASVIIPNNPPVSMTTTELQVALHVTVDMTTSAATMGPYNIPNGTV